VDQLTVGKEPKAQKTKKKVANKKSDRVQGENLLMLLFYASLQLEHEDRHGNGQRGLACNGLNARDGSYTQKTEGNF